MFLIMIGLALLLFSEYRFFHQEYVALQKVKQEYERRLIVLKDARISSISAQDTVCASLLKITRDNPASSPDALFSALDTLFYYITQVSLPACYLDTLLHADARCTLQPIEEFAETKQDIDFRLPIDRSKFWLSSYFGMRKEPNGTRRFHYGIDLAALKKTPVMAAADGIVEQVNEDPHGYGKNILIKHDDRYKTRYAHLDSILVKSGQRVIAGTIIGKVGDTGNVRKKGRDASHLHFELYELGKRINPLYFLECKI